MQHGNRNSNRAHATATPAMASALRVRGASADVAAAAAYASRQMTLPQNRNNRCYSARIFAAAFSFFISSTALFAAPAATPTPTPAPATPTPETTTPTPAGQVIVHSFQSSSDIHDVRITRIIRGKNTDFILLNAGYRQNYRPGMNCTVFDKDDHAIATLVIADSRDNKAIALLTEVPANLPKDTTLNAGAIVRIKTILR